uniref:Aa_trans domain-containing protein n=1 Tax=Schistocephalus solidus TaxID=70667 RepID=A0A183SLM7_SCHSO
LGFIRKRHTYACIAADAFPRAGRLITGIVVGLELFGASILYIILLGTSVHAIATYIQPEQKLLSIPVGITVFSYLCLPLLLWPNMRVVAWSSFIAVIGLISSIVAVLVGSGLETTEVPVHWDALTHPNTDVIPISVGIILFSFCAHTILPGIEGNMSRPEFFPRMLNVTFTCATVVKVFFGVFCVLAFGRGVEQSVTDNIVNFPVVAILAHACVMINVFFSLPLVFLILGEHIDLFFIWLNPTRSCGAYRIWILASRGALLSLGIFLAVQVPNFAIIMGLVGSLTGSLLCFIFPCLFSLKLFWKEISWCGRFARILILIFGVVGGVIGIIYSAAECASVFSQ